MLAKRGLITAPCGVPPVGVHRSISFTMSCLRNAPISSSTRPSLTFCSTRSIKPRVWNGIEVALKIDIHHKGVAVSKQPLYFPKRIFTAKPRAKAVAHLKELPLKDGLQHKLERRLHDAVFHHRNPQGTNLPASFGNFHAPHGLWPVGSLLKSCAQFLNIHLRPGCKPLHALTVYSCCARVPLYLLPCRLKRLGAVHFVDQAEPLTSFDAVFQRRQHALSPHRSFHPRPVPALCVCALRSQFQHCRRFALALLPCGTHASTFLSPFPRRGFAFRPSRGFHRFGTFGTMETLTPAPLTTHSAGLPAYLATPSCRSVSNHVGLPEHRFVHHPQRVQVFRTSP